MHCGLRTSEGKPMPQVGSSLRLVVTLAQCAFPLAWNVAVPTTTDARAFIFVGMAPGTLSSEMSTNP